MPGASAVLGLLPEASTLLDMKRALRAIIMSLALGLTALGRPAVAASVGGAHTDPTPPPTSCLSPSLVLLCTVVTVETCMNSTPAECVDMVQQTFLSGGRI